jgi:hypothetical protein
MPLSLGLSSHFSIVGHLDQPITSGTLTHSIRRLQWRVSKMHSRRMPYNTDNVLMEPPADRTGPTS